MTVRRQLSFVVDLDQAATRVLVERKLRYPQWRNIISTETGFILRYRPASWPLTLSTKVEINFEGEEKTAVTATTISQRLIQGDVFKMYDEVLQRLQAAILG